MSIDVKAATEIATTYLQDLMKFQLENLRLEEVELSEDGHEWLITLGFDVPTRINNSLANIALGTNLAYQREYKIFKIDSEKGEVKSMKIRSLK
ncbi:MAG: hypothetical protein KME07_13015 [Pegethrix bostrychoides GSE-TBD4-15B]|jgi:hypothetical protein|uniref:Uncharacterized protein n=1 Tax=Pegethrix bostrychoides GSE-TBD4-15B TaxID=2839662 RepID=A0A951PBA3_9CYAN|nr:hypothetical protein [Pegethrix bostrychoides GSE-TBD4-15B]